MHIKYCACAAHTSELCLQVSIELMMFVDTVTLGCSLM
jgi:hypothetical protein